MVHRAPICEDTPVNIMNMRSYLDAAVVSKPENDIAFPTVEDLQHAAKRARESAPGPDGLPYQARSSTLQSFETLSEFTYCISH
eukprot:4374483-Pyramimonas_sp.AAC.1